MAGGQGLTISRYMSPTESRRQFPTLAEHGPNANELKGTVRLAGLAHLLLTALCMRCAMAACTSLQAAGWKGT